VVISTTIETAATGCHEASGIHEVGRLRRGVLAADGPRSDRRQGPDRDASRRRLQSGKRIVPAFLDALAQRGWVQGKNVQLELRQSRADPTRTRENARDLVGLKPDVIVASNAQTVQDVQAHTRTIPVVFVNVPDSVVDQLVGSQSRPEGNATGFLNFESSIAGKWLELLRESVPGLTRIGVLRHAGNPTAPGYLKAVEAAAAAMSISLQSGSAKGAADIGAIVARFSGPPAGGLVVPPSSLATSNASVIVAAAAKHRLAAIYPYPEFVAAGGLMSYGFDRLDSYRKAAEYVDRILRGARPSELPVQAPTKFQLVVNLKTAKAIGLKIPESFLLRADEVIE
jgi:putative ABC transport system substrate-binding protein